MKRILGSRLLADLTVVIILVGSVVLFFGFGSTIYLARQEVSKQADKEALQAVSIVQNYVDDQLQRVEDVGYTLLSGSFGLTTRDGSGSFVTVDPARFKKPSEDETFRLLEQFLNANPHICGVAVGFEPDIYPDTKGQYGFAAYVTNVSGRNESLSLGEIHNFREKEWYVNAAANDIPQWSRPFAETSQGEIVACYSIPLHGLGDRLIGVLAMDINTVTFRNKCNEVAPLPGAEVALVDSEFNFISHPNSEYLLRNITDVEQYSSYTSSDSLRERLIRHESGHYLVNKGTRKEAMFYFAPVERTGWTISVESPTSEIYSSVNRLKRVITIIGIVSILFMLLCYLLLFRRIQKVTISKAGIERDLDIASKIQMGMLPKLYPAFPDRTEIDVYGFLKPAKTVGGDLYDYFIRDEKFFFCIGDVSGKGVPASLFMAVIRALFRNISLHTDDPAEILSSLNTALSEGNTHNMFCTMFLGVMDLRTGHLDYCNAGHNAPVVRRVGKDGSVDVHFAEVNVNIAVGVFEGFPYQKQTTNLNPGDAIFLYTDGVTEAENQSKQLFGDDALLSALASARKAGAVTSKDFVDAVYKVVRTYAQGTEQSDDITMTVVEYKGCAKARVSEKTVPVLHLKNSIDEVPTLGEWVEMVAGEAGLPDDKALSLNLALEEAVVNVMKYAYPDQEDMPVDVSCEIGQGTVTFVIDDHGVPFDPTAKDDPDITLEAENRPIGGLGIFLVKNIMDSVSYERVVGHNRLTMVLRY